MVRDTLYFPIETFVNGYVARWKGNKSDSQRSDKYVDH